MKHKYTTNNPIETEQVAAELAKNLKGGEVIGLIGELGAGKTAFVKGLAKALKVKENVTSPTFVVLKIYPAKIDNKDIQLVHVDAYRTENPDDIKSVGIEDYLDKVETVTVIEWADKIRDLLPRDTVNITFTQIDENTRKIEYDLND